MGRTKNIVKIVKRGKETQAKLLLKHIFFVNSSGIKQLGSNAFITGPGRYRKVEEKQRNDSVKFAGCNSATLKSYDLNGKASKECFINEH